jgi:hypothetical protein
MRKELSKENIEEIRKYPNNQDWNYISRNGYLSVEFIREFSDYLNWSNICFYQSLSEEFIREFNKKVVWFDISFVQTLSEDFIKEFQNDVNWNNICRSQKLSKSFIIQFIDKIKFNKIIRNPNIHKDVKDYLTTKRYISAFMTNKGTHGRWDYDECVDKTKVLIIKDFPSIFKTIKEDTKDTEDNKNRFLSKFEELEQKAKKCGTDYLMYIANKIELENLEDGKLRINNSVYNTIRNKQLVSSNASD